MRYVLSKSKLDSDELGFTVGGQEWPPTRVTISIDGRTNYFVSKAASVKPDGNKRDVCRDIVQDFFACEKVQGE